MQSLADADNGLVLDVLSILVLSREVASIDFGLVVEIADNLDGVCSVKHFDIILIGGNDDADCALGGLDEIVLLQSQKILSRNRHPLIHFQVVLIDPD